MPYSPTNWTNDAPPPLNAANLNKLTDELESQALTQNIAHALPTWVDGSGTALTDGALWNEIERVLRLVSQALGDTYTRTVWSDAWTPARNALNLNKIEQQLWANRTTLDLTGGAEVLWGGRIDRNGYIPPMAGTGGAPQVTDCWDRFEDATHFNKKVGWIQWGTNEFAFVRTSDLQTCRDRQAIPHFESNLQKGDGTQWTFAQILAGSVDSKINAFANTVAAWGFPCVYRMWHEFNGPWSLDQGIYGDPVNFVKAWEYVVKKVRPIAPNCTFMWCCNGWSATSLADDATPYLPNPLYIDAWGMDTYRNTPMTNIADAPYQLFQNVAPDKLILWEFGYDHADAQQAEKMISCLDLLHTRYDQIDAINFFHRDDNAAGDNLTQRTFDMLRPVIADVFYREQAPLGAAGTKVVPL